MNTSQDIQLAGKRSGKAQSAASIPQLRGRVLLVDDTVENHFIVGQYLRAAGLQVVTAENGQVAVNKATSEQFDLILLDMHMPVMDGYTAARVLRERGCGIPIIALTASVMVRDRDECFDAGCDDYLTKPFERDQFFTLLSRYLAEDSAATPGNNSVSSDITEDPKFVALTKRFVDRLPERVSAIENACDQKDWETVRDAAHKLASAQLFGFPKITDLARSLELAAADQAVQEALDAVNKLASVCDAVVKKTPAAE